MERDGYERPSKVPDHLRPFLRPSLTTEPVLAENSTFALQTSPSNSVELCPSYWRLPPKRSLRSTLKAILLKEWPGPSPQTPRRHTSHDRPVMMRMKDSDDYITARAANPWTGLISPSIGSLTPRLQNTPDSPGEALYVKKHDLPLSPTPDTRGRPVLKRANEGRKVSCGNKLWKADENGWLTEVAPVAASPRITRADVEVGMVSSRSQPLLNEDALVVHMPSAQEPQPYAYPGYSAKQIEAAEFYKRKARRVSSEGYDQRIFLGNRQTSSDHRSGVSGVCKVSSSPSGPNLPRSKNSDSPVFQKGHITVAKRRIGPDAFNGVDIRRGCQSGAQIQPATFAPFSSPKTPAMRVEDESVTELQTAQVRRYQDSPVSHQIHRKQLNTDRDRASSHAKGLKSLPKLALVHPTLAALPQTPPHRQQMERSETRKCSFGCTKDLDGNVCVQRRTPLSAIAISHKHSLFDQEMPVVMASSAEPPASQQDGSHYFQDFPQPFEILATAIISIIDACRHVILPRILHLRVFAVLRADDRSPQQKADALKHILSTAGQALIILGITATLWYVGSAIMHGFEVILWPVLVPFKILRWLGGGA